jgi:hypothetical protein
VIDVAKFNREAVHLANVAATPVTTGWAALDQDGAAKRDAGGHQIAQTSINSAFF